MGSRDRPRPELYVAICYKCIWHKPLSNKQVSRRKSIRTKICHAPEYITHIEGQSVGETLGINWNFSPIMWCPKLCGFKRKCQQKEMVTDLQVGRGCIFRLKVGQMNLGHQ